MAGAERPTLQSVVDELEILKAMIGGADPGLCIVSGGMMTVAEACSFSTLSRSELYSLMSDGTLRAVQYGRRRLVPRRALLELLAARLSEPVSAAG